MPARVLLVGDKPEVIETVRRHLDGCDVHTATTLDKAREELRLGAFEFVLCDPSVGDVESLVETGLQEARPKNLTIARGAIEPGSNTKASFVLKAIYSLVHDTRSFVTGLAVCLGTYRQNRLAGRAVSDEEIAVLDRQVLTLGAMCREYARVESAMRPEEADFTSDATVNGFGALLGEFGMRVDSIEVGEEFSLPGAMRGTLSRGLLHVALALLELGADGVRIRASRAGGWEELRVSYRSRAPMAAHAANESLREAMDLLSSKGAKATVEAGKGGAEITMSFAHPPVRIQ